MRFAGVVGYAESQETEPNSGIWENVITEFPYRGDVQRDTQKHESGEKISDDISVNNAISIVGDDKANQDFLKMVYVMWRGTRWKIESVEFKTPRLLLNLGGVYTGPTPTP